MIDWVLTEERFGKINLKEVRPKVIVKCDQCGKRIAFIVRVKNQIQNNQLAYICHKCACNKKEVKEKHSEQITKQWKDEEYRKEHSEISRLAIADHRYKKNFASWFISRTCKLLKKQYKMVIAFADTTFGHTGIVYKAANFKLDGIVAPSY